MMMNQILEGWKTVLKDYRYWKMIIEYPYDAFDCAVFFGNLGNPPNSLDDWVKEMKELDPEYKKILYDNLWELYDGVEKSINETDNLLEKVDEVLKND